MICHVLLLLVDLGGDSGFFVLHIFLIDWLYKFYDAIYMEYYISSRISLWIVDGGWLVE